VLYFLVAIFDDGCDTWLQPPLQPLCFLFWIVTWNTSSLQGKKTDFVVNTNTSSKQHLLIVEIKPPKHAANDSKREDLVKLGNEMKDSIDKMINDGIDSDDLAICGLLIEGK